MRTRFVPSTLASFVKMADSNSVLRSVVIVDGIPNIAMHCSMNVLATALAAIFQMGKAPCHRENTLNTFKDVEEATRFRKAPDNNDIDVMRTTVEHNEGRRKEGLFGKRVCGGLC